MDYDTLTRAIYVQYKSLFDRAPAATLALLLVALPPSRSCSSTGSGSAAALYRASPGRARPAASYASDAGSCRRSPSARPSSALFLVLPAGVLGYWLSRGIANERELDVPWSEAADSLGASSLAAGVAVLAALPVACWPSLPVAVFARASSGSRTPATRCPGS